MITTISHAATFADSLKRVLKPQGVPHLKARDAAARILGQRDWRSLQTTKSVSATREDIEMRLRSELASYPDIDVDTVVASLLPPANGKGEHTPIPKVVEHILARFGEKADADRVKRIAAVVEKTMALPAGERHGKIEEVIKVGHEESLDEPEDWTFNHYTIASMIMREIAHPRAPDWMDHALRQVAAPFRMLARNEGYARTTVRRSGAASGMLELQDRLSGMEPSAHAGLRHMVSRPDHAAWPFVAFCALHHASVPFADEYRRIRELNKKEQLNGWDQGWTRAMFDLQDYKGIADDFGNSVSTRLWELMPDQMSRLIDQAIAILPDLLDALGPLPDTGPHRLTLDDDKRERAVADTRPRRQWTPRWRLMSINDQSTWGFSVHEFEDNEPTTWVRTVERDDDPILDAFPGIGREPGSEWVVIGRGERRSEIVPQSIARITTQEVKGERSEHIWTPNRPVYRVRLHEVVVAKEAGDTKKHARGVLSAALYTLCSERLYDYAMLMTGCVVRIAFSGSPKGATDVAQDVRRMIYEHIGMPTQGNLRTINIEPLRDYSEGDWLVKHHRGWVQPC